MPRPKSFDRDAALDKAMEAFWQNGYEGTSVGDLLAAMGINRGSLYDTFGDKHALFEAAIDRYATTMVRSITAPLEQPGASKAAIVACLEGFVDRILTDADRKGCFMVNAAVELGARDPALRDRLRAAFERIEDAYYCALVRAADKGEISRDRDLRALARYLSCCVQGLRVVSKVNADPNVLRDIVRETLAILD